MKIDAIAKLIETARSQIGVHEGRSNGHWNNIQRYSEELPGFDWSQGQPWCHTYASWNAWRAGLEKLYPMTASCDVGMQWWKDRGEWSEYPVIGGFIYFGVPGDATHVGICTGFTEDEVHTNEGNTNNTGSREGDGVYKMVHQRRSSRILGYGAPFKTFDLVSADPARRRPSSSHPLVDRVLAAPAGPERHKAVRKVAVDGGPKARQHARAYLRGEKLKQEALAAMGALVKVQ